MAVESLTTQGNLDLQALLTKLSENDMTSSTDAGMLALLNQGKDGSGVNSGQTYCTGLVRRYRS
jgi:hypothetical protein